MKCIKYDVHQIAGQIGKVPTGTDLTKQFALL